MSLRACRLLVLPALISAMVLTCTAALAVAPGGMMTRTFKVPPDLLSCDAPEPAAPAGGVPDGVPRIPINQEPWSEPPRPRPAQKILEANGLEFPAGASASFDPVTSLLTVTNTVENMEQVAGFMALLGRPAPANVAFTVVVVEGPGGIIREADAAATKSADAMPALAKLLEQARQPGSEVRVVGDAFLETKSGTRATLEAVRQHHYAAQFQLDAKGQASVEMDMLPSGLSLEVEPVVGVDRHSVGLTYGLTINAVPPVERQVSVTKPFTSEVASFPITDAPGAKFISGYNISAGQTKLIGLTKPTGTPLEGTDTLWAVFLTTTLRPLVVQPAPQTPPQPVKDGKAAELTPVPKGMVSAALPAPDGLFAGVLGSYPTMSLQAWLARANVSFPTGSSIQHQEGLLHVVNTPENIELIAAVVDHLLGRSARTVAFTLHTVEAPAALLRDLARQTLATADDTAMLTAVEAAAARGEARFINSVFLETKPGTRATHDAACEHTYLSSFRTDAQGRSIAGFTTAMTGSRLELEPTIGADSRTVELSFSHELPPTGPVQRLDPFHAPGKQGDFELPMTDFHLHKTTTSISVSHGGTKLISLNAPTGRETSGVLWATFLTCAVVPQVAPPFEAGRDHASKSGTQKPLDPKTWNTRTFHVPPDFLATCCGDERNDGRPVDPFAATPAAEERPKIRRVSAKEILEAQGVPFPEGATASFNPALATLFIKNTNENLALVEIFVNTITKVRPKVLAFTTHVLQGPGPLLRRLTAQAAPKSNHRAELDELLAAVKAGSVQHLNTARIETASGTRATSQQGMQHSAITSVGADEGGKPIIEQQMRQVGLQVELEPTVGADGMTIELTLAPEYHTAPPREHQEHFIDPQGRRHEFPLTDYHTAKVVTGLTLPDGTARLLSLYRPTGRPELEKEDVLQVMFITCDVVSMRQ